MLLLTQRLRGGRAAVRVTFLERQRSTALPSQYLLIFWFDKYWDDFGRIRNQITIWWWDEQACLDDDAVGYFKMDISLISTEHWSMQCIAQCVHWTVFFPFDRERWDTLSNLETVILLNIYLSQRTRSKGTMRKLDFREPQTLNLWFSLKYSPVVTTKYAPLFPCYSPLAMVIPL